MAIYKLNEICKTERGNGSFKKNDLSHDKNLEYLALHYGKTYKLEIIDNDFSFFVDKSFLKTNSLMSKNDVFLISTSETVKELGKVIFYNADKEGILGGEQIKIIPDNTKVLNRWLFYWLKMNQNIFAKFATGIKVYRFKRADFSHIDISLPSLEEQQKIIDIIEPIEKMKNKFMTLNKTVLELIKKIELSDEKIRIIDFFYEVREKPKNIKQISAKVLSENKGLILKAESPNTYKTNTFYCNEGTFIFCSIRTYLQKWGITPFDADVNGTLFQFEIKKNLTPLINYLKNESSWSTFNLLSKGTKMPVLSKKDFLNIEINKTKFEIKKIDLILKNINKIIIDMESLIEKSVSLLVK